MVVLGMCHADNNGGNRLKGFINKMGKQLKDPKQKVMQRSIGFPLRQHMFFAEHPSFKPDTHCRRSVDDQIAEIDPKYLDETDVRKT